VVDNAQITLLEEIQ